MSRESVAQQPPSVPLDGFPDHEVPPTTDLYRAHDAARGPWWFSSAGGRFDLSRPRGTCYLADDPLAALRERLGVVLGASPTVPASLLESAVVSRLRLAFAHRLADLQARRATRYGVTRELDTMVPYDVPQAWARGFAEAGYDGVRYRPRFTTGRVTSDAVFGPAGAGDGTADPDPTPASQVPGAPVTIEPPRRWDLTVVATPRGRPAARDPR